MTAIAPWLSVPKGSAALSFYRAAFGAEELERLEDDDGEVVVAQLSIEGADFWIQADEATSPDGATPPPVRMILTVDDPDFVFARALGAGGTVVTPIYEDYGWRIGRIADPSGHHWEIGKRLAT
jgi:PhnB protein